MKRLFTFLFIVITLSIGVWAQDTIPHLLLTEGNMRNGHTGYFEISNLGDTALDLSQFGLGMITGNGPTKLIYDAYGNLTLSGPGTPTPGEKTANRAFTKLWGILEPGESFVGFEFSDKAAGWEWPLNQRTWLNNERKIKLADLVQHEVDATVAGPYLDKPEIESYGFDSVDVYNDLLWTWNDAGYALWWFPPGKDSVVIDLMHAPTVNGAMTRIPDDVAGTPRAIEAYLLVRKFSIKRPNNNWVNSKGVDPEDSEWLLQPMISNSALHVVYPSSVRTHGDFHVQATSTVFDIDLDAGTIKVPWGTQKGDSITQGIEMGPGMSYVYYEDTLSQEDSAHTVCQTGDILELYAYGNLREVKSLKITVIDPPDNLADLFSVKKKIIDDPVNRPWGRWTTPYIVTEKQAGKDSIRVVPYGTRVDSLFKYLEMAPGATSEMIWVDGVERVDVTFGDIIRVTSKDKTVTKDYVLSVEEYEASDDFYLGSITWPDYPADILLDWNRADTLPDFTYSKASYTVLLPYGTKNVPALVVKPRNTNASVETQRALSLFGGIADRTTTVTVTAEDDSTEFVYTILFDVEVPPEDFQVYVGDPFISEVHNRFWWNTQVFEIYNPSNVDMDLSRYILLKTTQNNPMDEIAKWQDLTDSNNYSQRFAMYVPGFLYPDHSTWVGKGWVLETDPKVNPIVKSKDVFVMSNQGNPTHLPARYVPFIAEVSDVDFSTKTAFCTNTWDVDFPRASLCIDRQNFASKHFLMKIVNDSIFNGTKAIGPNPDDFEIIDCFGFLDPAINAWLGGRELHVPDVMQWRMVRKPNIYLGHPELFGYGDSIADKSEWIVDRQQDPWIVDRMKQLETLGAHTADEVTIHNSKVSSLVYVVSIGYTGLQSIQGDMAATNVEAFMGNLIKADTGQTLELHSSVDGSMKTGSDPAGTNDTLFVISANKVNTTKYLLDATPLDDDATLVAKDGSGLVVAIDGSTGTITGMDFDATITSVLEGVTVPALATWTVNDPTGTPIPELIMNYDTLKVATKVGDRAYIEVVAQNGHTITYQLMPTVLNSDAFVISDLFTVDQDLSRIQGVPEGIAVSGFLATVIPATGATMKVLDKMGMERPFGIMAYDDLLHVTSQDGSKTVKYVLDFLNEVNPDWEVAIREITKPVAGASMLVYPNPASETITIEMTEPLSGGTTLRIFNITGGMVDARHLELGISRYQLDISHYRSGVYYLQLIQGNASIATQKLIVQ